MVHGVNQLQAHSSLYMKHIISMRWLAISKSSIKVKILGLINVVYIILGSTLHTTPGGAPNVKTRNHMSAF